MEITTVAELGTATGTLVLAIATFGATRSANRSARIAERSLLLGLRPTLAPSHPEDRTELVDFGMGNRTLEVPGGEGVIAEDGDAVLFAMTLRNIGAGPAVLLGWHVTIGRPGPQQEPVEREKFRDQRRDLYIPPGDTGFWQGAVRDADDPLLEALRAAPSSDEPVSVHLLYSDQEGGQQFVSRFILVREGERWRATVGRHWTLDD